MSKADPAGAMILTNLMRQHDASNLWARDCGCAWHGMARAYIVRQRAEEAEDGSEYKITIERAPQPS